MRQKPMQEADTALFFCDCGTEGILGEWEDGFFFLSFWKEGLRHRTSWRDRLRAIWKIAVTGSAYTDQIVLKEDDARTLALWLMLAPQETDPSPPARLEDQATLLRSIKDSLDSLEALLDKARGHWEYEDAVYRFYHRSFKVYSVQRTTEAIVAALQALRPGQPLNLDFMAIVRAGTGKRFSAEVNRIWDASTRPLLEAFFHARFFLEMIVKYGRTLEKPPEVLPSGWAAVLYLYNLR